MENCNPTTAPFDISGVAPMFDYLYQNFSKTCTIWFNPTITACNCINSPSTGIQAAWITGGPINQFDPSCPLCSGGGKVTKENTESIRLILEFNPSKFDSIWKSQLTRVPKGLLQAKGFLTDMPKVTKCIYMRTDLQEYSDYKWSLCEEPVSPHKIVQGRYFTSVWERS